MYIPRSCACRRDVGCGKLARFQSVSVLDATKRPESNLAGFVLFSKRSSERTDEKNINTKLSGDSLEFGSFRV